MFTLFIVGCIVYMCYDTLNDKELMAKLNEVEE